MRFYAAIGVYLAFGAAMALGIVLTVAKGNPWVLLSSVAVFSLLFWRVGCTQH